jgi:hypothetical protein
MKRGFWILIIVLVIFSTAITLAELADERIELKIGENSINISFGFSPFYAKDLVNSYPDISVISHNENGVVEGYVNVFGGIGKNFLIEQNKDYEIIAKKEVIIVLK